MLINYQRGPNIKKYARRLVSLDNRVVIDNAFLGSKHEVMAKIMGIVWNSYNGSYCLGVSWVNNKILNHVKSIPLDRDVFDINSIDCMSLNDSKRIKTNIETIHFCSRR